MVTVRNSISVMSKPVSSTSLAADCPKLSPESKMIKYKTGKVKRINKHAFLVNEMGEFCLQVYGLTSTKTIVVTM